MRASSARRCRAIPCRPGPPATTSAWAAGRFGFARRRRRAGGRLAWAANAAPGEVHWFRPSCRHTVDCRAAAADHRDVRAGRPTRGGGRRPPIGDHRRPGPYGLEVVLTLTLRRSAGWARPSLAAAGRASFPEACVRFREESSSATRGVVPCPPTAPTPSPRRRRRPRRRGFT